MHKAIVELGSINKQMKLKFNMYITEDVMIKQEMTQREIVSMFEMGGNHFFKMTPHPYLVIDISNSTDRGDAWNSNLTVNLGMNSMYLLQKKLKLILQGFQEKDLFYKQRGKLTVDQSIASNFNQFVQTSNKMIRMVYAVVPDVENKEIEYEGISFMINTIDNFCLLTYNEIELLYYRLSKIDLHQMAIDVMNTYLLKRLESQLNKKEEEKVVIAFEEEKQEIPETPVYPEKEKGQIPEI